MMVQLARQMLVAACLWAMTAAWLRAESHNQKLPVPGEAAQAKAMKVFREIYKADYAKAKSLAAKRVLAAKLLQKARETRGDVAGKFVLLKLSRDIATQGLDGYAAFDAVDAMAETFEIDPVEMKAAVLKYGAAHAKLRQHHKPLGEVALSLVDTALAEDNYSVAKRLCDLAAAEAAAAGEPKTRGLALQRGADVEGVFAGLYEKAQTATAMLNADPVNPEANAAQGKFLCFVKDDWDKGVLMLALGNVPELKAIAEKELDELSPVPPLQIADGWWKLAEKQQGIIKTRMCRWAARWYRQALPELSGLEKERVEMRIRSVAE